MKKPIIIIFSLLFSSILVRAQDSKSQAQPDSVIKIVPLEDGRHTVNAYTIGGKLQTREDVLIRLMRYAPSATELSAAKKDITWGYISDGGFAISVAAAAIEYATHNKHTGETTGVVNGQLEFIYQHHSLAGTYILAGLATGFLTAAIIKFVNAGKHGSRALKLYNQQYE
jgi:hypothetical protein